MTANGKLAPQIEAGVRASFAKQGLMTSFGASITTLAPGRCTITLPYSEAVGQQHGFFHGGIIGAFGDTAGGYAALTVLPSGSEVLTLEYKINFLRPAAGTLLLAEGLVLRAGRSVIVTRVDVSAVADGKTTLCSALQQSIVPAQKA